MAPHFRFSFVSAKETYSFFVNCQKKNKRNISISIPFAKSPSVSFSYVFVFNLGVLCCPLIWTIWWLYVDKFIPFNKPNAFLSRCCLAIAADCCINQSNGNVVADIFWAIDDFYICLLPISRKKKMKNGTNGYFSFLEFYMKLWRWRKWDHFFC